MSIRNLFFRESECKKPPTARSPAGYGLRTLFGGLPRFASRASDCGSPFRAVLVLGASHPFCGLPRFASRASDCGSPFRAVLVLGASHPFWRPAPLCVAGFGLRCRCAACSPSVLRTLFAARPALRRGLRTALPLRGVLALGASHPFWRPAPLCVACFGLR